jgi:hypothetical protein
VLTLGGMICQHPQLGRLLIFPIYHFSFSIFHFVGPLCHLCVLCVSVVESWKVRNCRILVNCSHLPPLPFGDRLRQTTIITASREGEQR